MKLLKRSLNKFNGLYYNQDYLCLARENFEQPLSVYLIDRQKIIKNVTDLHLFVGYCPVVFAFNNLPGRPATINLLISQKSFLPNDHFEKKDALAYIAMKKIHEQVIENDSIVYYAGIKGSQRFLTAFHQFILSLYNRLYNKKPGNVFLKGNLLKQVHIAYAIPRVISLISISQNGLYNLFPTDLHGSINPGYYIISLRHAGKAASQVEATKRIVISNVDCSIYKTVYGLGKNHMQGPKSKENFPFAKLTSSVFKLPLPEGANCFRELELVDSFIIGIHKIFLFKVINSEGSDDHKTTLAHIHNVYATWRHNNQLSGNYLLR
jgi:flavin reductase (DIM6/NTAB) family NADH-FMN oxidoreductase RutF